MMPMVTRCSPTIKFVFSCKETPLKTPLGAGFHALHLKQLPPYNNLTRMAESSTMPFALRHHSRFPVFSPVRYERGDRDGVGTVTNISPLGWRISGSLSLMPGDVCALTVRLPTKRWVSVAAGKVRWVRGDECGIETLVMSDESHEILNAYLHERIKAL